MPRKKVSAFTLVELLIVLVLMGVLMIIASGFSKRARDTFVSQQFLKTMLMNTRVLRRKSMLISRNSNDRSWVYGIGFSLKKNIVAGSEPTWSYTQIRLTSPTTLSYYYRTYPDITSLQVSRLDDSIQPTLLATGLSVTVTSPGSFLATETNCVTSPTFSELLVVFESINGKMHAYCKVASSVTWIRLGAPDAITPETQGKDAPDISIAINYSDGTPYSLKLKLRSNGEVNVAN